MYLNKENNESYLDNMILDENEEIPTNAQKKNSSPGKSEADVFRTVSGSLTRDTLLKTLEDKDKMMQEFKKNSDNYGK